MKKHLVIFILLLFSLGSRAQLSVTYDGNCDTCLFEMTSDFGAPLQYVLLRAASAYMQAQDPRYMQAAKGLKPVTKSFIISSSAILDFLPAYRSQEGLKEYPPSVDTLVNYEKLEFQVLQNDKLLQDWKAITSLEPEKEYKISYPTLDDIIGYKTSPTFHAGEYFFQVGDKLLLKIREKGSTEIFQYIYVERIKATPPINSIIQFPATTTIQNILNKELGKRNPAPEGDKLEVEHGNSMLLSFERISIDGRAIEYAFSDNPDHWTMIRRKDKPGLLDYYIFIDKPDATKPRDLLLRYQYQRESIRRIKIIVRPKLTQTTSFKIAASLVLAFLLFITGYYVNRRANKRKLRQLTFKKEEVESKLQLLSGQLNPHFLFNSLNSIQNMINKEEMGHASDHLSQVSAFLRTVMDAGKKEYISLREELDIAKGYLQLEEKRKPFEYHIQNICMANLSQIDFPPLLLQPVLENSIHHGFNRDTIHPLLYIETSCVEKNITVSVSDNGKGFIPEPAKYGHGLSLVQKRIALMNEKLNSNAIEMKIISDESGTVTIFTLKNWL